MVAAGAGSDDAFVPAQLAPQRGVVAPAARVQEAHLVRRALHADLVAVQQAGQALHVEVGRGIAAGDDLDADLLAVGQHDRPVRQRVRRDTFNISLVGYTNAGKSTLFNALVKARTYAADQLFATLDTTTRQLYLGEAGRTVSLSDTVGFIRDLPHGLVDAFAATLQEAVDADLLLHVVDASSPDFPEQMEQVQRVLTEIDAQEMIRWKG